MSILSAASRPQPREGPGTTVAARAAAAHYDARVEGSAQIRGTTLMSFRAYVEKTYGEGGFRRVLSALPAEDRAPFEGIVLASAWYPVQAFVRAIGVATAAFGLELPERYGEFGAEYEIGRFFRFILRFSSPGWLFDRGTRVWRGTHSTGAWEIERKERFLRGSLASFAVLDPRYCRVLVGWIRRAALMTGARSVKVEHPQCRCNGAPACVFELSW